MDAGTGKAIHFVHSNRQPQSQREDNDDGDRRHDLLDQAETGGPSSSNEDGLPQAFSPGPISGWVKCNSCGVNRLLSEALAVGCSCGKGTTQTTLAPSPPAAAALTIALMDRFNPSPMQEVLPHLWIGDCRAASDLELLQQHSIACIVNCAASQADNSFPHLFEYRSLGILDDIHTDIRPFLEPTAEWIHERVARGSNCLVFCMQGVSRSATMLLAYLILKKGLTLSEALDILRRARPSIKPNAKFLTALQDL